GVDNLRLIEFEKPAGARKLIDASGGFVSFKYRRDGSICEVKTPEVRTQMDFRALPSKCMIKATGRSRVNISLSVRQAEFEHRTKSISPAFVSEMVWRWLVVKPQTSLQI